MAKVFKLSQQQKDLFSNGAILGVWDIDGTDSINNTVKYLNINELGQAEKYINTLKNTDTYKNTDISNERKCFLKNEVLKMDNGKIKNICLLLLSNNKKEISVPKKTIYKLLVKTFNFTIKVAVVKSVMTCVGNETPEDTVWTFETVKDFITIDDLVGCKYSDDVLKLFNEFMVSKKELSTNEAVVQSFVKMEKNIDEIKSDILNKLEKFLSSYTMKYIVK